MQSDQLLVTRLGECQIESPLLSAGSGHASKYINEDRRVLMDPTTAPVTGREGLSFELAGPRRRIFFEPGRVRAAILTAGGLCPGINDVIRALVMELNFGYGVREVLGVRYGYLGLTAQTPWPMQPLTPQDVDSIHNIGGTILGSSRGRQDVAEMVDMLARQEIDMLFCVGGDGTIRGAHELAGEIARRGLPIAIVCIPKTIDNDIDLVFRSFGFQTAVAEATRVIGCAHIEAKGAPAGVGLVRLMGRESGAIAAYATLASGDANYCLVPELPFPLEGPQGLLEHLRERLRRRRHAVIAVAEGAGQHLVGAGEERDDSGNIRHKDIGTWLKRRLEQAFAQWGDPINVKYFDPSYIIRSVPANAADSIFCSDLARYAVHGAMAGRTDMMVGLWHGIFTHVPLGVVAGRRKSIDPKGNLWRSVLATTGQPPHWGLSV